MSRPLAILLWSIAAVCSSTIGAEPEGILFREGFDDANLLQRGWYDGDRFRIAGDAVAGKGCIEYEWIDAKSPTVGSSPVRHLFEPTDEVFVRYYLKLSKDWG